MTERRERLSRVERRKSIRMTERRERLGEVKKSNKQVSRGRGGSFVVYKIRDGNSRKLT
jgi:c-di-AMP phosphodiesterase-like protein